MKSADNIKILLVEDDKADYILFRESLNDVKDNRYVLTWASTYDEGLELIRKKEHDIYFFDYRLGAKTGLDLIEESMNLGVDIPIIILTGLRNQQTDMKAMELGAADFLVKGEIDGEQLERSIRYCIEHSRMLKKLKASETKFRSIFENSHDVIYISKEDGQILDINKSAERLFGYTREEMLNLDASELYDNKTDRERFIKEIQENGSCANFEVVLLDKSGNKKYCSLTANLQRIDESGEVYYQGIVHDMSLRKKAEHDLIIAEKLMISGKIARTLAHEVRNPLTNINLSTEQLEEYITDETFSPYFEIIKRNSKRINSLVTELLENFNPSQLKELVVPVKIIHNTLELAKDRAQLKNIKIETDLKFEGETILADESKLTIALLNIVMNAIEAVEMNVGVIRISGFCNNAICQISIEDNGSGIPAEHLAKVFEPYYTSKPNGMGLGLATSQNIIVNHKGKINVETELNKGTKFNIELNLFSKTE